MTAAIKNVLPHCDKPVNFPHDRKAFQENTPINNFISIFDLWKWKYILLSFHSQLYGRGWVVWVSEIQALSLYNIGDSYSIGFSHSAIFFSLIFLDISIIEIKILDIFFLCLFFIQFEWKTVKKPPWKNNIWGDQKLSHQWYLQSKNYLRQYFSSQVPQISCR